MTRLIDADSIPWDVEGVGEIPVITKEEIDQLPTVDIPTAVGESVGVIRCKDCKWFGDIGCAISIVDDTDKPSENDFCSWAERKRRMSYYQTMYGTDDMNTQFTDKDAHFGELVLRAIRDVDCPMLITTGEREAVKKALIKALNDWAERKEE